LLEAAIEQSETGWLTPELLRLKGELLLLQSTPAVVEPVEGLLRQRWTSRAGKRRCPGSCALRQALPACCAIKVAPALRLQSCSQSMNGLPKGSIPPT
jgi:hypothetical protein